MGNLGWLVVLLGVAYVYLAIWPWASARVFGTRGLTAVQAVLLLRMLDEKTPWTFARMSEVKRKLGIDPELGQVDNLAKYLFIGRNELDGTYWVHWFALEALRWRAARP